MYFTRTIPFATSTVENERLIMAEIHQRDSAYILQPNSPIFFTPYYLPGRCPVDV